MASILYLLNTQLFLSKPPNTEDAKLSSWTSMRLLFTANFRFSKFRHVVLEVNVISK